MAVIKFNENITIDRNTLIVSNTKNISSELFPKEINGSSSWKKDILLLEIKNGVEVIEDCAFKEFDKLKIIEFPDTLKHIGNSAFARDYLPGTPAEDIIVIFNEGLKSIGNYAFANNKMLDVVIPSTVDFIGEEEFTPSIIIRSFVVDKKNLTYSDMELQYLYDKKNKEVVIGHSKCRKLPKDVKKINKGAFSFCEIQNIEFPDSLKIIDKNAFEGCPLEEINLNEGIEEVGECAFASTDIRKAIIKCNMAALHHPFDNCKGLKEIYVDDLDESTEFYKEYKDKIKALSIDTLIYSGMSIKDINKYYKKNNNDIER